MKSHEATQTTPRLWHQELDAFIASRMSQPFAWGGQDCCLFPADAIVAMGGPDHAATERGRYDSAESAMRVLRECGGLEAVGARAGEEIPPLMARTGDVGLISHEGRQSLAMCCGSVWLAPSATGLAAVELRAALKAWRVVHG